MSFIIKLKLFNDKTIKYTTLCRYLFAVYLFILLVILKQ